MFFLVRKIVDRALLFCFKKGCRCINGFPSCWTCLRRSEHYSLLNVLPRVSRPGFLCLFVWFVCVVVVLRWPMRLAGCWNPGPNLCCCVMCTAVLFQLSVVVVLFCLCVCVSLRSFHLHIAAMVNNQLSLLPLLCHVMCSFCIFFFVWLYCRVTFPVNGFLCVSWTGYLFVSQPHLCPCCSCTCQVQCSVYACHQWTACGARGVAGNRVTSPVAAACSGVIASATVHSMAALTAGARPMNRKHAMSTTAQVRVTRC